MTPGTLNLAFTQGDGYSNVLTLRDALGNAFDQSAVTWRPDAWTTELTLGDMPSDLIHSIERLKYGVTNLRAEQE